MILNWVFFPILVFGFSPPLCHYYTGFNMCHARCALFVLGSITPHRITIDHDTLTDNCVTLRDRDTMKQERVPIEQLSAMVEEKVGVTKVLEGLG